MAKVFVADSQYDADVKVFKVSLGYDADLCVHVRDDEAVQGYLDGCAGRTRGLGARLHGSLVDDPLAVDAVAGERGVVEEVYGCVADCPLIDKYDAYQIVDDAWTTISGDLENLQTNGMPVIHIELKNSGVSVSRAEYQIQRYYHDAAFTGIFSLVQVFVAMPKPAHTNWQRALKRACSFPEAWLSHFSNGSLSMRKLDPITILLFLD